MTELEAINLMLGAIGEAPVDNINATGLLELSIAKNILTNINRSVQARGWWFNREEEFPMPPDVNQEILLPNNLLKIDTSASSATFDVVERARKLYDKGNHTFNFSDTLYCDVVWHLPFTDLPEQARWYVAVKAARRFQDSLVGSQALHSFTQDDEAEAYAMMLEAETDAEDFNITDSPDMHSIVHRRHGIR